MVYSDIATGKVARDQAAGAAGRRIPEAGRLRRGRRDSAAGHRRQAVAAPSGRRSQWHRGVDPELLRQHRAPHRHQDQGAEVLPGAVPGDEPVRSAGRQQAQVVGDVPELGRNGSIRSGHRKLDDVQLADEEAWRSARTTCSSATASCSSSRPRAPRSRRPHGHADRQRAAVAAHPVGTRKAGPALPGLSPYGGVGLRLVRICESSGFRATGAFIHARGDPEGES